jgi:hypothetical protein
MKKNLHFRTILFATAAIIPFGISAQTVPFTDQSSLFVTPVFHSGNAVGVVDMNNDGKDDVVRASGNSTMYIEYQGVANGAFTEASFPSASIGDPWGMCVGDYDNNGFNDVLWGDYGATRILTANATGTNYTSDDISTMSGGGFIFVQGCNFIDLNNDGKLDAFVCHDSGMPHIYVGNGTETGWTFNQSLMPLATVPASDNSGNYASIWTDVNADGLIDLMITHCRQGVSSGTDPRRIDQIFINNGNGTYTQDVTNWTGLRDGQQGWSTGWGDIDNDGDMDAFVLNQTQNAKMQVNNGAGVFTNIMATTGIANPTSFFGENATFQDFNNDGFVDLFLSGGDHKMYINNGNGTFTLDANAFVYAGNTITAHAIGDLNNDGFLDLYASYCDIYNSANSSRSDKLWMNNSIAAGNTNHYIKFHLNGIQSNKNGIGAIVKIYGPWGVQVREVRSGEAYGLQNSFTVHFGLGSATSVDSVIVHWPSGTMDETYSLSGDQTVTINEGGFPLSTNNIAQQSLLLNVYPNPMTDQSYIRLDHFASLGLNNLSVNIYDLNGKVVYTENALQQSILVIDRSKFANGIYMVEVSDGKGQLVASQKLLVQ